MSTALDKHLGVTIRAGKCNPEWVIGHLLSTLRPREHIAVIARGVNAARIVKYMEWRLPGSGSYDRATGQYTFLNDAVVTFIHPDDVGRCTPIYDRVIVDKSIAQVHHRYYQMRLTNTKDAAT